MEYKSNNRKNRCLLESKLMKVFNTETLADLCFICEWTTEKKGQKVDRKKKQHICVNSCALNLY